MPKSTTQKVTFGGVYIPREVFNSDIPPQGKLLYGVIQCLDGEDGCYASNAYLADACSVSESTVKSLIGVLIEKSFVIRKEMPDGYRILVSNGTKALAIDTPARKLATPSQKSVHPPARKLATNIQEYNNKNIIDTISLPHGDGFKVSWDNWVGYRKEKKKTLSERTIKMQLAELATLSEADAIATIEQSIKQGWTGLFAIKTGFVKRNGIITKEEHSNGF
jgi:hypothetical protein